jgi:nucleoside-diphosphate-sugar epimerase
MQKAFVTGGSGFVGRNLIARLVKEGVATYALSRSASSDSVLSAIGAIPVRGDIHDQAALERGMAGVDTVFHLAASVDFWKPAKALRHDHVDGTKNVITAARAKNVESLIYLGASSVVMNGKPVIDVNEDFKSDKIIDGYSITKLEAEDEVLKANSRGLRTISIRPPLIWGKGDTSALPKIKHAAQTGNLAFINGGTHRFVTCHVLNVVEALILAARSHVGGEAFFVTDGEALQFKQFIKDMLLTQHIEVKDRSVPLLVARAMASLLSAVWKTFRLKHEPPLYPGMVNTLGLPFIVSDKRARVELGYRPVVSVVAGLKEMAEV